jgi:hypothetical protein
VQVTDGLAATPTESFAEVLRRYARWDAIACGMPVAPWSKAALLFFLLAGVSIGRLLRVEYSGLTRKAAQDGSPSVDTGTVELPDVPGDVQNYKLQHEDFPHDSTAEQWFTESQFESYRRLGRRVVARIDRLFSDA